MNPIAKIEAYLQRKRRKREVDEAGKHCERVLGDIREMMDASDYDPIVCNIMMKRFEICQHEYFDILNAYNEDYPDHEIS